MDTTELPGVPDGTPDPLGPTSAEPVVPAPFESPAAPAVEPAPVIGTGPSHQVAAPAPPVQPVAPQPVAVASQPAPTPRSHGHAGVIALALVGSLLISSIAGFGGGLLAAGRLTGDGGSPQAIEVIGSTTEEAVAAAAAVAVPSVVHIAITGGTTTGEGTPEGHPDFEMQSEGSGVAYKTAEGGGTYIITNNHVVEGAKTIVVTDSTGESHDAELVGADSESDIAVVKVDVEVPLIEIGDSERLVVGQTAIAIGSPFGLEASVTSGVISALHRPLTDGFGGKDSEYPYVNSIQTDAAINPGNSGGALIDRTGALIGVPSAIYSDTGVADGVGLAIPVETAVNAADQLIEKGSVDTPFLGVVGQTVTEAFAAEESLPVEQGAYVAEVTPGAEAEKAGIEPGDVIVGLDDTRIRSMDDLILAVRRHAVGDTVTITLWRDGEKQELEMKVGIKPADLTTD